MSHWSIRRYLEISKEVDKEFGRNRRLHGNRIQCRLGCTDCCHHIFQITEVEAAHISSYVKTLPPHERRRLVEKARAYRPAREALMLDHGYIQARGNLPSPETRLACPALVGGSCAIYKRRPLTCRKYGMPLYQPEEPQRIFACELNFQRGERIEDSRLVQIQTALGERWQRLQQDYDRAGGKRYELPISVADAIIDDFEGYLPQ